MPKPCAHKWRQVHGQRMWKCEKCAAELTERFMQSLPMKEAHEVWTGRVSMNQRPQADAQHWVARDKEGKLRRVAVADMEDSHIIRWVCHFRSKTHGSHRWIQLGAGALQLLDLEIASTMITGPRILDEMVARGLVHKTMQEGMTRAGASGQPPMPILTPAPAKPPQQMKFAKPAPAPKEPEPSYPPGYRHIELGDD